MSGPNSRSRLGDSENRKDRKQRQLRRQANDGVANGLVEIVGVITEEISNIVDNVLCAEQRHDKHASIIARTPFEGGLSIETESEKLAQHIADALASSRRAQVTRVFDDEGKRRVLTCKLP